MDLHTHHHHHHASPDYNRAFAVGVGLNITFVVIEVFYGVMADSLALITDAGHNLSDVMGLLLAWGATYLAGKRPSLRRTYGYSRATILASMFSGLLLLAAVVLISWEAINRFFEPVEPGGQTIMIVAGIGVLINSITAWFFVSGKDHDLNIRGAYLHMAADALVSLGVVVSGFVIWKFGLNWFDPLSSLIIAAVI
ncbi:MAG: cation transporter, partial [Hyphomicrobiales bacterium]|nr:cation transporter [Hyphomicrobiales bacterium]